MVVHCAGLTRNPVCQADPERAWRANVEVTARLAGLAAAAGAPLLFLSTDLVFDGTRGHYRETDAPNPLSVYAETKAEAERRVLAAHPAHVVIRTSLNHGASPTGDRSFTEDMLRTVRGGGRLSLFTDEYRCPIAADATARSVWSLARRCGSGSRPTGRRGSSTSRGRSGCRAGRSGCFWPRCTRVPRPARRRFAARLPGGAPVAGHVARLQPGGGRGWTLRCRGSPSGLAGRGGKWPDGRGGFRNRSGVPRETGAVADGLSAPGTRAPSGSRRNGPGRPRAS